MNKKVKIIILPSEEGATMNHDAAGGVGCKIPKRNVKVFPPMTCIYIAAILKREGFIVQCVDGNVKGYTENQILGEITEENTTYILYGSLPTINLDLEILKRLDGRFQVTYVNAVAGMFLNQLKNTNVCSIVSGDAEKSIVSAIDSKEQYYYEQYLDEEELNGLPYPDWSVLNMDEYTSYTIQSSRGCSLGCPHCPYYRFQRSYYTERDVENVVEEIKYLYFTFHIDYFLFRDPCFSFNMERTSKLVKRIAELPFKIKWGCETRIDYLNRELIKDMKRSGCHHIRMGIESVNGEILEKAGRLTVLKDKDLYLEQAKNVVDWCKEVNIYTVQFYMVGFPDDSVQTIKAIKTAVNKMDPDVALINYLIPYPGTVYREQLIKLGYIEEENTYSAYGSKDVPVSRTRYLSGAELKEEKEKLEKYFIDRNRQFYPIR